MNEGSSDCQVHCSRAIRNSQGGGGRGRRAGVDDRRLLPAVVRMTSGPSLTGPATEKPRREGSREFRKAAPRFRRGRGCHLPGAGRGRSGQKGADGPRTGCGPCGGWAGRGRDRRQVSTRMRRAAAAAGGPRSRRGPQLCEQEPEEIFGVFGGPATAGLMSGLAVSLQRSSSDGLGPLVPRGDTSPASPER